MNDTQRPEEPDPLQPDRNTALFVPVRPGPLCYRARLFRTPLGARTAVAFTDERQLTSALGEQQAWVRLCEPAIRALVAPLGVVTLTVDPLLAVPGPGTPSAAARAVRACPPAASGGRRAARDRRSVVVRRTDLLTG